MGISGTGAGAKTNGTDVPDRSVRPRLGKPRLLIVGCGDIGSRIVARLARRYRIVAVTATSARSDTLRALGAVPLVMDLDRRRSLDRIAAFGERVIHLAPPSSAASVDMRTRRLVSVLSKRTQDRRQRAVYISTSGVYGDHQGRRIDETARLAPSNERALRRIDGEQIMRARLHSIVLRVPGIYALDRLPLDRLRQGTPALSAADDVYTNHIHADDLARASIVALLRGAPTRVVNVSDDSELTMGEYFDLVADRCGLPRPPRLSRTELAAHVTPMMLSFMRDSRRLSNRRLKRELRLSLQFPTVDDALTGPG
jgi:nucleoside-diphosphate-sugar epimerase